MGNKTTTTNQVIHDELMVSVAMFFENFNIALDNAAMVYRQFVEQGEKAKGVKYVSYVRDSALVNAPLINIYAKNNGMVPPLNIDVLATTFDAITQEIN